MCNNLKKIITIFLVSVQLSVALLAGKCNECFATSKIACLDETHFSTCFEGTPTTTITKCPGNRVCTEDVLICRSLEEGYTPACYHDYCGDCAVNNGIFTCLDETTYGFCFGNTTPLPDTLRSCPQGFVCNYDSREVCVPQATYQPSCKSLTAITTELPNDSTTTEMTTETTIVTSTTTDEATESTIDSTTQMPTTETTLTTEMSTTTTDMPTTQTVTTTETPTTPPITTTKLPTTEITTQTTTSTTPKRDPITICKEIDKQGYFKSDDPTCRQYVYCYLLSGQYLGWFYYCDGYFNEKTQKCQKEPPLDCVPY